MNYKQRILDELLNLHKKIIRLEDYEPKDELMKKQLDCMCEYFDILLERLINISADTEVNNMEDKDE